MRISIFLLFGGALLMSCESLFLGQPTPHDPLSVYNYMWKEVNNGYSFMDVKNIDWDSVYVSSFVKIREDMTDEELFDVMADALFVLEDGHVNLSTPFNRSRNWTWYLDYPQNFNRPLVERNYWQQGENYTGPFIHKEIAPDIAYVRYESFASDFGTSQLDYVLAQYKDTKGMILDLRDNTGGSLNLAITLASRFADQEREAYRYRYKAGPGKEDFDPWTTYTVEPAGEMQYTKPVVILTNRLCYSATNFFISMVDVCPHITKMGDSTGGGAGVPIGTELPNGWYLRYSGTQSIDLDGNQLELGIAPDIRTDMDSVAMTRGMDSMIEEALDFLE